MGILSGFKKAAQAFSKEAKQNKLIAGIANELNNAYHTSPADVVNSVKNGTGAVGKVAKLAFDTSPADVVRGLSNRIKAAKEKLEDIKIAYELAKTVKVTEADIEEAQKTKE